LSGGGATGGWVTGLGPGANSSATQPKGTAKGGLADGEAYAAKLLLDNDDEGPMVNKRMFDELRNEHLDDAISLAGSEEDEVIAVEGEEAGGPPGFTATVVEVDGVGAARGRDPAAGEVDELTLLMADTPFRKLKGKEKEADKVAKSGDAWGALRLRQEALALARMYSSTGPYRDDNRFPMLLPNAHFKLAKSYAELQCIPQAAEHCNRAMESLPVHGQYHDKVVAFKRELNILMGETLLMARPPKPQVALQHFLAAVNAKSQAEVADMGVLVLIAQCHALIGDAKLQEAKATREACGVLEQRLLALEAKLEATDKKSMERASLKQKLEDTRSELAEEQGFESKLLEEARSSLDEALVETLMHVVDAEESRLREKLPDTYKQHPLLMMLYRRSSELSLKLAMVEGLAGSTKDQLRSLEEVLTVQNNYGFLPHGLLARTLKEKGAVLVAMSNYDDALKTYNELLELQTQRYPDDSAKQAVAKAETLKLIGNVYVAKRHFNRAKEHYDASLELFATYLGPRSSMVIDLEHRINELRAYVNDEE